MKRRGGSAGSFVAAALVIGLLAFGIVMGSGVTAVRLVSRAQAIEQARVMTEIDAREIRHRITDRMVDGVHPTANTQLADIVEQAVQPGRRGPVVRVKIWRARAGVGEILYSDLPELVGLHERLDRHQLHVLHTGAVLANPAPLERGEERTERGLGSLTEVYTRIVTPAGVPLLFETYQRTRAITQTGRNIAQVFTPVVILTLLVAGLVQSALAGTLIRRIRHHQRKREALISAAMEASVRERRRIANDLRDGPVQDMVGLCLGLSANAESEPDERVRGWLLHMAETGRGIQRTIRSATIGIYPPNLRQMGLEAALSDLLARLPAHDVDAHLDYRVNGEVDEQSSELIYRATQEAIRNVEKHARAANVWVSLRCRNGSVLLSVRDDGSGGAVINAHLAASGRLGLAVLADIIHDAGGQMSVTSDDTGTTLAVEIPAVNDGAVRRARVRLRSRRARTGRSIL